MHSEMRWLRRIIVEVESLHLPGDGRAPTMEIDQAELVARPNRVAGTQGNRSISPNHLDMWRPGIGVRPLVVDTPRPVTPRTFKGHSEVRFSH